MKFHNPKTGAIFTMGTVTEAKVALMKQAGFVPVEAVEQQLFTAVDITMEQDELLDEGAELEYEDLDEEGNEVFPDPDQETIPEPEPLPAKKTVTVRKTSSTSKKKAR